MKQYYDALGIEHGATQEDIKKAFRQKALDTHPDRNGGNDEDFKKINEAYSILSGKSSVVRDNGYEDLENDYFSKMNEMFSRGFGFGGFSGFNQQARPPENDDEIAIRFDLTLADIKKGKEFTIEAQKQKSCVKCNGIGGTKKTICSACNGSRMVMQKRAEKGFVFMSHTPCGACSMKGFFIENECSVCQGVGKIAYSEQVRVTMKGIVKQ